MLNELITSNKKQTTVQNHNVSYDEYTENNPSYEAVSSENIENFVVNSEIVSALVKVSKNYPKSIQRGLDALIMQANGYTYVEIAKSLNTSVKNVTALISRAKTRLSENSKIQSVA